METNGIFGSAFSALEKNLDVRSKKHSLIVSNLANMDTPNYRPFDFEVESAMARMLSKDESLKMATTDNKHLGNNESSLSKASLNITRSNEAVDVDKSMANLAQNSIVYNASAQILSKKYSMLRKAITGGQN